MIRVSSVEQRTTVQLELQRDADSTRRDRGEQSAGSAPDLPAQFAPDRATGTGDENPGAGEHGLHRRLEDPALGPASRSLKLTVRMSAARAARSSAERKDGR